MKINGLKTEDTGYKCPDCGSRMLVITQKKKHFILDDKYYCEVDDFIAEKWFFESGFNKSYERIDNEI